jgi:hypothetical protein
MNMNIKLRQSMLAEKAKAEQRHDGLMVFHETKTQNQLGDWRDFEAPRWSIRGIDTRCQPGESKSRQIAELELPTW